MRRTHDPIPKGTASPARPTPWALPALALALLVAAPALAGEPADGVIEDRFERDMLKAALLVERIGDRVPGDVRDDVRCVSVLEVGTGGFLLAGTTGRGFITCRAPGGDDWSAPSVLDLDGAAAGLLAGGKSSDVLMLFTDVDDLEDVVHATPVFQGGAVAAAGPEGVATKAGANPALESGVMTFHDSEGLYAGVQGSALVVNPDEELNHEIYGRDVTVAELLVERSVPVPAAAREFHDALRRWSADAAADGR